MGARFEGDDDAEVAGEQHGVYGHALGIIVRTCKLFVPLGWLDWLGHEVEGWHHLTYLVRSFQLVPANQNEAAGYVVESQLSIDLIGRCEDVPWRPEFRAAIEADFAKDCGRLECGLA